MIAAISLLLGAADFWFSRGFRGVDVVSYLDLADDFDRGDWWAFVNGHWSPIYIIILSIARKLSGASRETEYAVAHAANFAIYLYCVLCGGVL